MFKKIKRQWQHFLATIAEQNKATYGEGVINCCELKEVTQSKTHQSK